MPLTLTTITVVLKLRQNLQTKLRQLLHQLRTSTGPSAVNASKISLTKD